MNAVDITIVVVLAASVLLAFWKGFVHQVLSLLGWVLALLAARLLGQEVAPIFSSWLADPGLQLAAAYVAIVLVVLLASVVVSSAFGTLIRKIGLGAIDRVLGVLFGALRGLLIVVVAVAIASLTDLRQHKLWQDSLLLPYMESIRDWTAGHLDDYISK
jgi:membrane protein required for colicin V production